MDLIVDDFNTILRDFVKSIAKITPKSTLANNIDMVNDILNNKEYKTLFINKFIAHILIYKQQFDDRNDAFFLKDNFATAILNNKELKKNITKDEYAEALLGEKSSPEKNKKIENLIMGKIFEFKKIWSTLIPQNKNIIFEYMITLCELSQEYFIEFEKTGK